MGDSKLFYCFQKAAMVAAVCAGSVAAQATERHFSFTYEATTEPKGTFELENSVTWSNRSGTHQFDIRHELEFGITDRLQAALYFVDWTVINDPGHRRNARYQDSALELIYNLANPTTDLLGSAIYGEVRGGDEFLELEGKVILQKNIGPWIVAYNAGIEAGWEGAGLGERKGEFQQTLGLSYQIVPQFTLGGELLHEVEWPEWSRPEPSRLFAGPNLSVHAGRIYATLTPLIQMTHVKSEPEFQTRLIVGFHF